MEPLHSLTTVVFLLFICVTFVCSSNLRFNHFKRRDDMNNKVYTHGLLKEVQVKGKIGCVTQCEGHKDCSRVLFNHDSSLCRLYDHEAGKDQTEDQAGWQCWAGIDCGPPPPHDHKSATSVTSTLYLDDAEYTCDTGYDRTDGSGSSSCQADGTWSVPTLQCQVIPKLAGTKISAVSRGSALQCRNVISDPVDDQYIKAVSCADDETHWMFRAHQSTQSVARCCKIPSLQCEYIESERGSSASCYKNFQLYDCACWSYNGNCHTTMTNDTCERRDGDVEMAAVCCTYDNLICYVKEGQGSQIPVGLELTITCELGETMTACSGFNTGTEIQRALIGDIDGVDTCVVDPGRGNLATLRGYVSCCKYKQNSVAQNAFNCKHLGC